MENDAGSTHPTREQAQQALAEADQVRSSVTSVSATPWPVWFTVVLAGMHVILPFTLGGVVADPEWLLPRQGWIGLMLAGELIFFLLLKVARKRWQDSTGVALRADLLPRSVTVPTVIGEPVLVLASAFAFRLTGQPFWLFAAAAIGVVVAVVFHLWFVRLHGRLARTS